MIYTLTSDIFDIFTMNIFFNTIFQKRNKNIPYPIFISFFVLYEFIGFITNSYFAVLSTQTAVETTFAC